ncbi:TrkA C-terminal domain-containing protein [Haloarcula halophila]|uniref:TrkA C-terminal domain-containing protein n=1 Tax=Haloarcula TaxID=2237 RepID=UPI0023E410B5|nr:TrkA C-terminal domain-containing protein [Halomicroarcula sp. DFY41]
MLGLATVAGTLSGTVALAYRWYVRERVPAGLAVLVGLSAVALYMGTTTALGQVIGGSDDVLAAEAILANIGAFVVGGFGAYTGTRIGERLGTDLFGVTGGREIDADVSEIVRTVGRVTSVTLPEEIDDIVGYDPMPEKTKEKLAGRRFLFPRRLTKTELRERLVSRLKVDYGVGHVDLELTGDGTVEYLAIGSRAAGIGPTLPPATNAVAIQADPAHAASAGDLVQVWETDPLQRVLTGELRGVAGEIVTVAIDAADTQKVDPSTQYKLVTLPVQDRPDREFASLLRAADETLGTATVEAGSDLDGVTIGGLQATVVAITREGAKPEPIPDRSRVLSAGDILYAIATPDALRRLEAAAVGAEPSDVDASEELPTAAVPTTEGGDDTDDISGPPAAAQSEPAVEQPTVSEAETTSRPDADSEQAATTDTGSNEQSDGDGSAETDGPDSDTMADAPASNAADAVESDGPDEPTGDEADQKEPADDQSLVDVLGGTPDRAGPDDTAEPEPPVDGSDGDETDTEDDGGDETDVALSDTDEPPTDTDDGSDRPTETDGQAADRSPDETESDQSDDDTEPDLSPDDETVPDTDLLDSFADETGEDVSAHDPEQAATDPDELTGPDEPTDQAVHTADNIFESLNEGDGDDIDLDALLQGEGEDEDVAVWDPDATESDDETGDDPAADPDDRDRE